MVQAELSRWPGPVVPTDDATSHHDGTRKLANHVAYQQFVRMGIQYDGAFHIYLNRRWLCQTTRNDLSFRISAVISILCLGKTRDFGGFLGLVCVFQSIGLNIEDTYSHVVSTRI